jgi:predicted Rossmann fold flavoprotein
MSREKKVVIIGGGAAGVFAAIHLAENNIPLTLLEKSGALLTKVLLTGGGRCNLTNAIFDRKQLAQNYPRGSKELLSGFSRFSSQEVMEWFSSRGVLLKIEEEGKVYPRSDSSKTIVECLKNELCKFGVDVRLQASVVSIEKKEECFHLLLEDGSSLICENLLLSTGNALEGYSLAKSLGHTIVPPIPSLFSFEIADFSLKELSGVSVKDVGVSLKESKFHQKGSLLITHFGFSGPVILNLSSWAAKFLQERSYQAELLINWLGDKSQRQVFQFFCDQKQQTPLVKLGASRFFDLSSRLWKKLLEQAEIPIDQPLTHLSEKALLRLAEKLTQDRYQIKNKRADKGEFVFCGGVSLKEIDSRTFESKKNPHLYFAGEILDVDGITGGFNLQFAWTSGWIAAEGILSKDNMSRKIGHIGCD